jgi:SAM-dependent methyltransferase
MMKGATSNRTSGLQRLAHCDLHVADPYFLHYRRLFSDLQNASLVAQGRLLDIGCGNKPYAQMFAGRVTEYVGCDMAQSSENKVDVICPATAIPLDDASFGTVLCTQVIEHVADHRQLLNEAFRLLQSRGVLILSGPMYWPLHEEPYDFFRFTEHGLRYLLEASGFAVDRVVSNGGRWALCGQVLVHTILKTRVNRPLVVRLINRIFAYLDDRNLTGDNPMNYVVVAVKP